MAWRCRFLIARRSQHVRIAEKWHTTHWLICAQVVSQGAAPVGRSMVITRADGNIVRELDGGPVAAALDPVLQDFMLDEPGNLMVGVEVPTAAAAEGGPVVEEDRPYVVRQLLGFDRATQCGSFDAIDAKCSL